MNLSGLTRNPRPTRQKRRAKLRSPNPLMHNRDRRPSARRLEDSVKELLRPMLQEWLDKNMPRLVEAAMREQMAAAKLARAARTWRMTNILHAPQPDTERTSKARWQFDKRSRSVAPNLGRSEALTARRRPAYCMAKTR